MALAETLKRLGVSARPFTRPCDVFIINCLNPEPGMLYTEEFLAGYKPVLEAGFALAHRLNDAPQFILALPQGSSFTMEGAETATSSRSTRELGQAHDPGRHGQGGHLAGHAGAIACLVPTRSGGAVRSAPDPFGNHRLLAVTKSAENGLGTLCLTAPAISIACLPAADRK